jgi:hypothetical protein
MSFALNATGGSETVRTKKDREKVSGHRCRINMTQTLTNAPVSAAAERMRRHRARRREGLRSLTIELRETEIDALIRSGYLQRDCRNELNAVTQALYRVFDRIFR